VLSRAVVTRTLGGRPGGSEFSSVPFRAVRSGKGLVVPSLASFLSTRRPKKERKGASLLELVVPRPCRRPAAR